MENKSTPTSGQTGTTEDKLVSKDRDDETILLNENSNPSFANFATPEPALETSSAPTTLDKKTESSNMIIERDPSPMPTTTVQRPIIRKSCSASTLSKTATKKFRGHTGYSQGCKEPLGSGGLSACSNFHLHFLIGHVRQAS